MRRLLNEFKEFALKGNVMSLAVGVIIGSAFQGVVTSLTDNILSPIIGLFTKQNFDLLHVDIFGVTIMYGAFITSLVNFIIMAFVVFLLVKAMNKLMSVGKKPDSEPEPPETEQLAARTCPFCMSEIHSEATRCPACTSRLDENIIGFGES